MASLLIEKLNSYLLTRLNSERCTRCFHPSRISTSCMRVLYDEYFLDTYMTPVTDPRLARVFDTGHQVHDRIQSYLESAGILLEREVPAFDPELKICGNCDGLLDLGFSDLCVLEIKSINRSNFLRLYTPKPAHVVQSHIYMYVLGVDKAVLLYECKDDQALKEYLIHYDPHLMDQVIQRLKSVLSYIEKRVPPPKEDHEFCSFCERNNGKSCAPLPSEVVNPEYRKKGEVGNSSHTSGFSK